MTILIFYDCFKKMSSAQFVFTETTRNFFWYRQNKLNNSAFGIFEESNDDVLTSSFAIKLHYIQKRKSSLLAVFIVHNEAFVILLKNICFGLTREKERGARRSQQEIHFKSKNMFSFEQWEVYSSVTSFKVFTSRLQSSWYITQPLQKACSLHYLHSLKILLSSFAVALTCLFFFKCGEGGKVLQQPRGITRPYNNEWWLSWVD